MSVSGEAVPQAERLDRANEEALIAQRLYGLEREAARGVHTPEPVLFMAGIELEFQLFDNPIARAMVRHAHLDSELQQKLADQTRIPPQYPAELSAEEQQAAIAGFHTEARAFIEGLRPKNDAEQARKQHWLDSVPELGINDLINFRLYQEFSRPSLGDVAPPRNTGLDTLQAHTQQNGWLEFRFGNGILEEGYYDGPNIGEFRLNPCAPAEATLRYRIITEGLTALASRYGRVVALSSTHLNLSAWQADTFGTMRSITGISSTNEPENADALAGVAAAIQDGAWMTSATTATEGYFSEKNNKLPIPMQALAKPGIRIRDNHLELRASVLQDSPENGFLWMMAGVLDGLETGQAALADEGYAQPRTVQRVIIKETQDHIKGRHLQDRALQSAEILPNGGFFVDDLDHVESWAWLNNELIGNSFNDIRTGFFFNELVLASLRTATDGSIHFDPSAYDTLCQLQPAENKVLLRSVAERYSTSELAAVINGRLRGVRVAGSTSVVECSPFIMPEPFKVRLQRFVGSVAAGVAYGEHLDTYAQYLAETRVVA